MVGLPGLWMVHMPLLNVAKHFALSSQPTKMRVNAISGACIASLSMILVHFAPFGSSICTLPFLSALSLQPLAVVMVVLLIGQQLMNTLWSGL